MARYIKLDKVEPLPTDAVLDVATKSLQDFVWEAYEKAIKEQIVANTILIDKHFAKTNRILVDNLDIPPMICGLEIKLTEELPDGYNFALVEAPMTERKRIIKNAKAEVAREIFDEIESVLSRFAYPSLTALGNIKVITAEGWHIRADDYSTIKKKYTEGGAE